MYKDMKIYLDNCCFNRPYDNQSFLSISIEAQAKLQIQSFIKEKYIVLASSFILEYENSCNPYSDRKFVIQNFLDNHAIDYVGRDQSEQVLSKAEKNYGNRCKSERCLPYSLCRNDEM